MKIISFLALLYCFLSSAQIKDPPNGIFLKDNLYMDETEVANIHWLEYEFYIKRDSSPNYHIANLSSEKITENYRSNYLREPKYRHFPVVGVSYSQALNYCKWRSNVVNAKLIKEGSEIRIMYRLPTEKEWELAARSIDTLKEIRPKYIGTDLYFEENRKLIVEKFPSRKIDFSELKKEIRSYRKSNIPAFVIDRSYPWFFTNEEKLPQHIYKFQERDRKNELREYQHLIGNVAEMVQEKGTVKGGSWRHILATSFPSKRSLIDPEKVYDWVGFRCI